MALELNDNDRSALSLLLKYCFYRNWHSLLLINYANIGEYICYGDPNDGIITDINETITTTLGYLKQWTEGIDMTSIEIEDMAVIQAFNSGVHENGALLVIKQLFTHVTELQSIAEEDDNPIVGKLLRHIQRCSLLLDLWYAGEDITYFGTMLDLR